MQGRDEKCFCGSGKKFRKCCMNRINDPNHSIDFLEWHRTIDQIPDLIYKYRPINMNTIASLQGQYLWFSNPNEFNDPFDCSFQFTELPEKLLKDLHQYTQEHFDTLDLTNENPNFDFIMEKLMDFVDSTLMQQIALCCFSECFENVLMWSHYSSEHKGICLGFSHNDFRNVGSLKKVSYEGDQVLINTMNLGLRDFLFGSDWALKMVFNKTSNWFHEKEIRYFTKLNTNTTQLLNLHQLSKLNPWEHFWRENMRKEQAIKDRKPTWAKLGLRLREVHFGLRTPKTEIDLIKRCCIGLNHIDRPIKYYKMVQKPGKLELQRESID